MDDDPASKLPIAAHRRDETESSHVDRNAIQAMIAAGELDQVQADQALAELITAAFSAIEFKRKRSTDEGE